MSEATKRVIEYLHKENEELKTKCNALEKRVTPNKPSNIVYYDDGHIKFFAGNCPICKTIVDDNYLFCFKCGQALDWSNLNENS